MRKAGKAKEKGKPKKQSKQGFQGMKKQKVLTNSRVRNSLFILLCIVFSLFTPVLWAEGRDIKAVSNQLRFGKTVKERLTAIRELEDFSSDPKQRDICVLEFTTALKDSDAKVRLAATTALGRLGHQAQGSRAELAARLKDPDKKVQEAANSTLGKVVSVAGLPRNALFAFLVLYLPALIGSVIVLKVSDERKVFLNCVLGVSFLCLMAKAVFVFVPSLSFVFDGSDAFIYLERDFAIPFGILFFAVASRQVPEEGNQRALKLMTVLLLVLMPGQNYWVFTTPPSYSRSDGVWIDGVCMQSTSFTCGAASAATVLRAHGVPDAVEHECAYYSHTLPFRGVTDLGAARALRQKAPGRKVEIRPTKISELKDRPLPCMAPIKYSFWFDHMVVVLAVDEKGIWIGDPLKGRVQMTEAELEKRWLGRTITLE